MVIRILILIVVFYINFAPSWARVHVAEQEPRLDILANDDFATTNMLQPVIIKVLTNDYGFVEDEDVIITITQHPERGKVEVLDDNTLLYTPGNLHVDEEAFEYRVCNQQGDCDEAMVTVAIIELDVFPELHNDTLYIVGTYDEVNVLVNDTNLYNRPLEFYIEEELKHGQAEILTDSIIAVSIDPKFYEIDSLKYTICDADGDCASAWLFIDANLNKGSNIFIPQGFSPNGDGYNDSFYIEDLKDYHFSLQVINRWGKLVYSEDQYQNNWNGNANQGSDIGNKLPIGTYYYHIVVKEQNWEYKGFVYITY